MKDKSVRTHVSESGLEVPWGWKAHVHEQSRHPFKESSRLGRQNTRSFYPKGPMFLDCKECMNIVKKKVPKVYYCEKNVSEVFQEGIVATCK